MKAAVAILLTALASTAAAAPADPPRQAVIISFDGAHEIAQWQRSRALAEATGARFTYFLSCVYLLTRDTRDAYRAPGGRRGASNVGFAQHRDEVAARLGEVWRAHEEGHEIASHGCGHFDGKDWSRDDWIVEFDAFTSVVANAWDINEIAGEPDGWRAVVAGIDGFRAPYLSAGAALDAALAESGFRYDASSVSDGPANPATDKALLKFALPMIPEGPQERPVIAMDYNLFVRHSGGLERPSETAVFEERALAAFKAAFEREYKGERRPLQIGLHFTLMNDGAYWRALERFATDVCARAEVDCISYRQLAERLAPKPAASLRPGLD